MIRVIKTPHTITRDEVQVYYRQDGAHFVSTDALVESKQLPCGGSIDFELEFWEVMLKNTWQTKGKQLTSFMKLPQTRLKSI